MVWARTLTTAGALARAGWLPVREAAARRFLDSGVVPFVGRVGVPVMELEGRFVLPVLTDSAGLTREVVAGCESGAGCRVASGIR